MDDLSSTNYGYYPIGNFDNDIHSIIEKEKKINEQRVKEFNEKKKNSLSTDIYYISEQITFVIYKFFDDIEKKNYNNFFDRDRWQGYGYLFISIYIVYFLSKL